MRLHRIFGEKHEFIPWYVLSAGTMKSFDVVMALINTEERQQMSSIWGELLYFKDSANNDSVEKLFSKIREISKDKTINKVLFRHADVFKYLGKEEYVDYAKARSYILKMLSALYNPEENLNFEYEGNPLRHVVEYLFRTANKFGILPDDLFDDKDQMVILDASRYLAGMTICCYDKKNKKSIKYYSRIRPNFQYVFREGLDDIVRDLINFSNACSHTQNDRPYKVDEDKKEIFFGKVLHLCHVIKLFGRYLEEHMDVEENSIMQEILDAPRIGEIYIVYYDKDNEVQFIGNNCRINQKEKKGKKFKKGEHVVVESISVNKEDNVKYPFFAYVKKIEQSDSAKKIPNKEDLLLKEGFIINTGCFLKCLDCCKLEDKYKEYIGKKIRVLEIEDNHGEDAVEIPYIATKVELIH